MLESLADPSQFADVDENDPRSIVRWAKKMGKEMGEEMGDDFDEMIEEMAASGELEGEGREDGGDRDIADIL